MDQKWSLNSSALELLNQSSGQNVSDKSLEKTSKRNAYSIASRTLVQAAINITAADPMLGAYCLQCLLEPPAITHTIASQYYTEMYDRLRQVVNAGRQ